MSNLWNSLIYRLLEWIEPRTFGAQRSGLWPIVRRQFLEKNPECAVCGGKKLLEVHHKIPVHLDKTQELRENNLIVLCDTHHFWVGHLGSYRSWNESVETDATIWRLKITQRP